MKLGPDVDTRKALHAAEDGAVGPVTVIDVFAPYVVVVVDVVQDDGVVVEGAVE